MVIKLGDYYEAVLREPTTRTWDVYDTRHGIPPGAAYLGSYVATTQLDVKVSDCVDDIIWEQFCSVIREKDAPDSVFKIEDIPETHPPMPEYGLGGIESLNSCIRATEYVLSLDRDDIEVVLARILANQITIMHTLKLCTH